MKINKSLIILVILLGVLLAIAFYCRSSIETKIGNKTGPVAQRPHIPPEKPAEPQPPPKIDLLEGFPAYSQQSGTSCGPCAVRNMLKHVTGTLHAESKLHKEVIEEDQKGLEHLAPELRRLGIPNPRMLSRRGTTPIGNTAVLNKYLGAGHVAKYKQIDSFEDRKQLIIKSINNDLPVMVPLVSGGFQHWTVCIGYDLEKETFTCVNAGLGASQGRPEGGSYNTVNFQSFDDANSFKNMPSGMMGRVYELANKEGIGKCVLIYIEKK